MNTARTDDAALPTAGAFGPGSRFGAYAIVREIHRGGMGVVYEARHRELRKRVALKTLQAPIASDPKMGARFLREGRAASRLRHPHVVDVSDFGVQDGVAFLVMEYLEGEDLAARLAREGAMPPERVAELLLPVCAAVAAIHRVGIVHRDLKPENIFLHRTPFGAAQPKVIDFGISKMAEGEAGLVTTGAHLLGTPCYMSPEQAEGAREADAQSDQYALGAILYECATGRRAFSGTVLFAVLWAIVGGRFDPPRTVCPALPERFDAMVMRAMSVDPAARYPSIDALARELLAFASPATRAQWEPVFSAEGPLVAEAPDSLDGVSRLAFAATPAQSGPKLRASDPPRRSRRSTASRRASGLLAMASALAVALVLSRAWRPPARPAAALPTPSAHAPVAAPVAPSPTSAPAPPSPIAALLVAPPPPTAGRPPLRVIARPRAPLRRTPIAVTTVAPAPVEATPAPAPAPPPRQRGANGAPIDE